MIYFLLAREIGLVKIGFTDGRLDARIAEIKTSCPHKLELLKTGEGSRDREADLHERYSDARKHGEWFDYAEMLEIDERDRRVQLRGCYSELEPGRFEGFSDRTIQTIKASIRRLGGSVALCDSMAIFGDFYRE